MKRRLIFLLLFLLVLGGGIARWRYLDWRDHSMDAPILAAARRYNIPPALVKAVVWRESQFDPRALGSSGEIGLMQVLPRAAAQDWIQAEKIHDFAPEDLLNPATNTLAGAWYLEKLLKRYAQADDPVVYALADYNAGRGNVLKWNHGAAATNSAVFLDQIGFPSTRQYVLTIQRRYAHYRPIFPPPS